jgi:RND family efflux transporter MFP subunit
MKRITWTWILILVAGLGGLGLWVARGHRDSDRIATVSYGDILDRIAARGRVEAKTTVDLACKLDGRIRSIAVKEGDEAAKDQILVTMDDEYAKAAVAQGRAELKDAELDYARSRRLLESNAVSTAEFDRAAARRDLSQARLDMAEAQLNDMYIVAPISGRVISRYREPGESVKAGIPILSLSDVSSIRVRAEIDEDDVGHLALGQEASIVSDAYPGRVFIGKVIEIGERVGKRSIKLEDPSKISDAKILETKIELPETTKTDLKLGMTVDVIIDVVQRRHVLVVPRRVIQEDKNGSSVTMAGNGLGGGKTEVREVVLGARDRWDVEVLQGLKENEKVVIP